MKNWSTLKVYGTPPVISRTPLLASLLLAGAAFSTSSLAQSDTAALSRFYSGNTVKIVVGLGAGGSYDITARTLARNLGKNIPGNPTVIVENMPGAGSLLALNRIYTTMPKDGTVIGNVSGPSLTAQVFGTAQFDAAKMRILSAPAPIVHMLVATKASGASQLADLVGNASKREIKMGATAQPSSIYNSAFLAKNAAGLNFRMVTGYDGFAKIKLALEQDEVGATFNNIDELNGLYRDKINSGEWRILAQSTDKPHPRAPKDAPVLMDLAKNPEQKQMYWLGAILPMRFAFLYFLAPGVPSDRADALELAVDRTFNDTTFADEMRKAGLVADPIPAADMRKMVAEFTNMPADIKAKLQPILMPKN
jgi:tripartite-type tricarboxylate transporter receptor subunit TctC